MLLADGFDIYFFKFVDSDFCYDNLAGF